MAITWVQNTWVGGPVNILGVEWSPTLALFVAVGNGSAGNTSNILTSPDGVTWTVRTHASDSWVGIAWSPSLAIFVVVGASTIATSSDGINWTVQTEPNGAYKSIAWSPALNLFAAVSSSGGAANQVTTSPDGINWTTRTAANANAWSAIIWAPEIAKFVAVAYNNGVVNTHNVMTSLNGILWTEQTTMSTTVGDNGINRPIAWSGSLFAAVNTDDGGGTFKYMTSPDGVTWSQRQRDATGKTNWDGMVWAASQFLAFGAGAGFKGVASSSDGVTWNAFDPGGTARNWEGGNVYAASLGMTLAFNSDGARFVLAGSYGLAALSLTPSTGPQLGGTPVTITGTGFVAGATVAFGGTLATSVVVVNPTTITCVTPAHAIGLVSVVITNPDLSTSTLTNAFTFTIGVVVNLLSTPPFQTPGQWSLHRLDLVPTKQGPAGNKGNT